MYFIDNFLSMDIYRWILPLVTDGAWPRHVSSKCSRNDGGSME